ncbi:hypothetical protein LCGC14_3104450 [marine sediment metagenome]|uniref:Uncharacterized protein n=1 Tax=marine sediment metagenome TaxID=412755 RepID=A0A0F8YWV4_9ZZZZ
MNSKLLAGATWGGSVSIGDAVGGHESSVALPLKPGTYLAKAIDSSGIRSLTFSSVSTKDATVLAFGNLDTISEHPNFPGVHSGTVALDDALKLAGVGLFDSIPDFDALFDLDSYGGVNVSGIYDFSAGIDLGAVKRCRLSTLITALVINPFNLIDHRTAMIDSWEDFDGAAAGDGDIIVEVRETDDDPGGSPTWSAWARLDQAEKNARGFDFRARLSTTDPAYNISVSELTINAEEVV